LCWDERFKVQQCWDEGFGVQQSLIFGWRERGGEGVFLSWCVFSQCAQGGSTALDIAKKNGSTLVVTFLESRM
jgi:hypothetical protein